MQKDFDSWNKKKKHIQKLDYKLVNFHEQEIWWCSLGLNLGDEEDGKNQFFERPVLIVKKFNNRIALVVPLSTQVKYNQYYHLQNYQGKVISILLSQLKLVSAKRFRRLLRKMGRSEFNLVLKKLKQMI